MPRIGSADSRTERDVGVYDKRSAQTFRVGSALQAKQTLASGSSTQFGLEDGFSVRSETPVEVVKRHTAHRDDQ